MWCVFVLYWLHLMRSERRRHIVALNNYNKYWCWCCCYIMNSFHFRCIHICLIQHFFFTFFSFSIFLFWIEYKWYKHSLRNQFLFSNRHYENKRASMRQWRTLENRKWREKKYIIHTHLMQNQAHNVFMFYLIIYVETDGVK